jgi:hypothetical protein
MQLDTNMVGSNSDTGVSIALWYEPVECLACSSRSVQFYGVIPGGQSFQLNQGTLTTVNNEGYGFNWITLVRAGTTVLLVGGDSRGIGSAGWTQQNVNQGGTTCLNSSSPSSTPGSPAGGAYPTGSNGVGTGGGGGGGGGNGSNGNGNGGNTNSRSG